MGQHPCELVEQQRVLAGEVPQKRDSWMHKAALSCFGQAGIGAVIKEW